MARWLRIAPLFLSVFFICFLSMVNSSHAGAAPQNQGNMQAQKTIPTPTPPPSSDRTIDFPYFTLRDGMESTLTLNNNMSSETKVNIAIFNTAGKGIQAPPMTLEPQSIGVYKLEDLLGNVGEEFDSGNIEVRFTGPSMGVTGQVGVSSVTERVSFESRLQDPTGFTSSKLNGVVSIPDEDSQGFLAVTSTASREVTVQVTVGSKKKGISLLPRQTQLLKLNEEFDGHRPLAALIQLQDNGNPGDIIATGFVLNLKDGYSSVFTMFDPSMSGSSKLAGAHFRFGEPAANEGFPKGTDFRSPLFLANASGNPVSATVSADYTTLEETKTTPVKTVEKVNILSLKSLTLAPGEVQRIELDQELAKLGVDGPVEDDGVEIDYQGAPGSLIGELTSVDQTGDYSFEVPVKDPAGKGEMAGGSYPWTLDDGADTILHLKNTTDETQYAFVRFVFPGGAGYSPAPIQLKPHQTAPIDIQKLKDSKKPDVTGRVFPVSATNGKLIWMEKGTPHALIGRGEQVNAQVGIARSFSCGYVCPCTVNFADSWMYPGGTPYYATSGGGVGSYTDAVGYSGTPFYPRKDYEDCGGHYYPGYTFAPDTSDYFTADDYGWNTAWSSDDADVASVDPSSGAVTFNSAGSTTIRFDWDEDYYYWDDDDDACSYDEYDLELTGTATVQVPTSLYITSEDPITYSGSDTNECGDVQSPVIWGHSICVHYQLKDQYGNSLTSGSYTASESNTVESSNPSGQTFDNATNISMPSGVLNDFLEYATDTSPGVPSGYYAHVQQVITVKDTNTNVTYTVRINCNDFESSGISITDITSSGTCS